MRDHLDAVARHFVPSQCTAIESGADDSFAAFVFDESTTSVLAVFLPDSHARVDGHAFHLVAVFQSNSLLIYQKNMQSKQQHRRRVAYGARSLRGEVAQSTQPRRPAWTSGRIAPANLVVVIGSRGIPSQEMMVPFLK